MSMHVAMMSDEGPLILSCPDFQTGLEQQSERCDVSESRIKSFASADGPVVVLAFGVPQYSQYILEQPQLISRSVHITPLYLKETLLPKVLALINNAGYVDPNHQDETLNINLMIITKKRLYFLESDGSVRGSDEYVLSDAGEFPAAYFALKKPDAHLTVEEARQVFEMVIAASGLGSKSYSYFLVRQSDQRIQQISHPGAPMEDVQ
jgi:hypothetical protein